MESKLFVVLGLVLSLAVSGRAQIGGAARTFPDTRGQIRIFTDQLPGAASLTADQWGFIATHYVGTQKELVSWTRHIHKLNPKFITLHYQLAVGAGTADFIDGDRWTNDFDQVKTHAAWFLRDGSGKRIDQNAYHWKVMDILFQDGTPQSGWPDYWVMTAVQRMRDNQNDGVFADSATIDILFGQVTPPYVWFNDIPACKQNWIPALDRYGAYCYNALHSQPEKFYYLPNLGGLITGWDTTDYGFGDGGMNEGFTLANAGSYYTAADWQLQMNRLLTLTRAGKILLCQSYIQDSARDDRWFVVGSYLLIKGHKTYLNMFAKSTLSWYPEYTVPLGAYLNEPAANVSAYWRPDWGVYRRDYAHGFVLVNPGTTPVRIADLGGTYRLIQADGGGPVPASGAQPGTLIRTPVSAVTVPAHSARVLLN
jgi:hypothetical protein